MAEKLAAMHLAFFGFLTISLGIEVSVPVTLVTAVFPGALLAIVLRRSGRRVGQAKRPHVTGIASAAHALCSANPQS